MSDVLDETAAACYETYMVETGDQMSPDWSRLTVVEREWWRRVVQCAWRLGKPAERPE